MTGWEQVLAGGGEMGARMRALDWRQTALGPVEDWPPALRTALSVVLTSPQPVSLFWGPELLTLYNDGFAPLLGDKHPAALGGAAREVFPDVWDSLRELFDQVRRTGTAVSMKDVPVHLNRQGFMRESYFTFSYFPVRDEHGQLAGVYAFGHETTPQVLGARRFKTLRELSTHTALARDTPGVLRAAGQVLAQNPHDVPFALLYRVEAGRPRRVLLAGPPEALGDVKEEGLGEDAGPWPLAERVRGGTQRLVETLGSPLPVGPWPEPVTRVKLLPLALGGGEHDRVLGVGLSPRLPLDEDYRDFLQLLGRQLEADLARDTPRRSAPATDARVGEASPREGLGAGAEDALARPFEVRELWARVGAAVRSVRHRVERERLLQEVEAANLRLARLVANVPAFVCTLRGPQHVYELVNPRYQRLVGEGRGLLGRTIRQAFPEEAARDFIQRLDDVYRTGEPFLGTEASFLADRGGEGHQEETFVDFIFHPWRGPGGQVEGIDIFGFDVTEQVRARQRVEQLSERLRESEERLRRVAEASGSGFWELEAATEHVKADARVMTLLGLVPGAPMTLELGLACVYPPDREGVRQAIALSLAEEEEEGTFLAEFRVIGLGEVPTRWVECRGRTLRGAHGRPVALAGVMLDTTARKQAEAVGEGLLRALGDSEERYRLAMRATLNAIWDWNLDTHGVAWSEGLRALFGYATEEVTPDAAWWLAHIHPEDRERISRSIHAIIDAPEGSHWQDEYRFGRRDGTWAFVLDRGWVARDASGRAVRMVGAMQDVSERKAAEALQARQSRHHALAAQVNLALSRGTSLREMLQGCVEALVLHLGAALSRVWLLEPSSRMLEPRAHAGLPLSREDAEGRVPVGHSRLGLIAQERRPHQTNALAEEAREDDPEWVRREGLVAFAGYPLLVGDRLVGVLSLGSRQPLPQDTLEVLQQVADNIALGVERLRAESDLQTRIDFEQKLIGIVSHDLRNPLSAILMGTALMARRPGQDGQALRSVLRIQSSAERATRMVKDLLDFTQARLGGGIQLEPREGDLHEVTRGVLEEVALAYPTRVLEARHEGNGRGVWDADRLAQVVQNLVTNALKYSPEDSPVRVLTRAEDGEVSLSVTNRGPPIPPDKLSGIFEPLQRATAEVDKTGRSVGLGLYIVKRIVDAHGGRVTVSSTPAEGTVFTVHLPRQRA